jgi:hypothetical protein
MEDLIGAQIIHMEQMILNAVIVVCLGKSGQTLDMLDHILCIELRNVLTEFGHFIVTHICDVVP